MRLEFHSITRIFDRGGKKGWKSPKLWDYIVSNTVAVFFLKKKGLCAPHPIPLPPGERGRVRGINFRRKFSDSNM
jgi:hypothetical protein